MDRKRSILLCMIACSALVLILIFYFVLLKKYEGADRYVQGIAHALAIRTPIGIWETITFFGSFEFLFPASVVLVIADVEARKQGYGIRIALVSIAGFLSVQLMKEIFRRPRPAMPRIPNVTDFSFPSGHSASSLIFCGVLAYSFWRRKGKTPWRFAMIPFCACIPLLIGASRIELGVHYFSDVIAGYCVGTLWLSLWILLGERRTTPIVKHEVPGV